MYPTGSSERSGQNHSTNDTGDEKNHNTITLSYNDNTINPTVYSNTIMTSFNDNEQFYSSVVGQVYSRETVTIYGNPPTNFWNQSPVVGLCYFCNSTINPQDIDTITCTSENCNINSHTGCLMKYGLYDFNQSWYCPNCMPPRPPARQMESLNDENIEANQSPPKNPLHLLLEASDQIQSNSRTNTTQINTVNDSSFTPLLNSSTQLIENNDISTRPKLMTSKEFIFQPFHGDNSDVNDTINGENEKVEKRNNSIRNLERTRTRQNQVTSALKESVARLSREHAKQFERYESLEKDNEKLNNVLQKLKLALVPLAQERHVLQILRKQNEDLQEQDIGQDNVLQLFLKIGTTSTPSNAITSTSYIPYLPTIGSSLYERCQKCSKIGGHLISCVNCHVIQHIACCSKGEKPSTEMIDIRWLCINCKNANPKRKNYTESVDIKVVPSSLIGGYKRIKVCNPTKENGTKSRNNSTLNSISIQNLDKGCDEGVLSPQLTPHKAETNEGNTLTMEVKIKDQRDSTDLTLPNTPMSGENESDDSSFTGNGSEMEMEIESNQDELKLGLLDRAPPSDNGPEATRQPARFDGDMYTPRWVRGVGKSKEGLCPHCEPVRWLKTKISAYWYHLNYQHGISSITGRPFTQPTAERVNKKTGMKEALCHKCNKWILNQSPRDKDVLVPEIYW
ncbi:13003_t:CDS:2 [Funneliformis geosporum]|uniref:13003_t:CDS:1 n=1 Tax=Funneliformis geosporum TaxID=1117311 RepID=A0A9W4SUC4_9GLOM|nr:13003_t:CDS:2 [Funneliformis geosporum]